MVERDARGRFRTTVSVTDVLSLFDEVEGPVIGTIDVADRLGCTRSTALEKLRTLEDRGLVESRRIGPVRVFWRSSPTGDLSDWGIKDGSVDP